MKYLNGDRVKDSNGQEWTVWETQLISSGQGWREICLLYSSSGDVKTCMASLLQPVEEITV